MRILYVLFFLLTLNSCQKVKEKEVVRLMKEWYRKEVLFPDDLLFTVLEKDTLKEIPKSDYTIITYVDSIGCTSCKLKLQNWLLLERKLRSITNKRVSCLFVIHPKSKKEVNYILQENHFDCPVCIDDSDIFNKLNKFPANIMYQTFLLDAGNKVVAIGNPIHNDRIKKLYLDIISGNKMTSKKGSMQTEITVSETLFDFGKISFKESQKCIFTLQNTGKALLVIDDVNTSCGCTSVQYSKEPVKPGESLRITVIYKADHPEHFRKTITIYCNVPTSPLQLKITGNAE